MSKRTSFGDDPDPYRRRRLVFSFGLAVVITAALVAGARFQPAGRSVEELSGPVNRVLLEKAPAPSPPPTPRPTLPPVAQTMPAPVPRRAAPPAAKPRGGARPANVAAPHPARPKTFAVPHAPAGAGVAVAAGEGPGPAADDVSGPGSGGGGGNGAGGSGTGDVNADEPCGYVEFLPESSPRVSGSTAYEQIRATVHFPDGHQEVGDFPYPWVYPNAVQTDPWSAVNARNANFPVRAQLPPPGSHTSGYPAVIRYVLDHTRPDGTTILQECPKPR